jgi:hypothetical protein
MATPVQAEHATEPCRWPTREEITERMRTAQRAVSTARNTAEDAVADTVSKVRQHPLRAVGAAMVAGAAAGSVLGLCVAWFMRPRRRWHW